jgi:hypothetical protein
MPVRPVPAAANQTREERIEAILKELRPNIEARVREMVERAVDVPEAEDSGPSTSSSVMRDRIWPMRSGKPAWRTGKKGVRRLQRVVSGLHVCGQVSLLPVPTPADGAWGTEDPAGLLLLRPLQAEFYSL